MVSLDTLLLGPSSHLGSSASRPSLACQKVSATTATAVSPTL